MTQTHNQFNRMNVGVENKDDIFDMCYDVRPRLLDEVKQYQIYAQQADAQQVEAFNAFCQNVHDITLALARELSIDDIESSMVEEMLSGINYELEQSGLRIILFRDNTGDFVFDIVGPREDQ
jgi:hypothetical protein